MSGPVSRGVSRTKVEKGIARRGVYRLSRAGSRSLEDEVVVEEPLEIRLAGEALAVTMRTPGADRALTLGLLFAEGVIAEAADLGRLAHCGRPDEEGYGNVIDAIPGPGVVLDPERLHGARRGTLTTASCGVCGRRSVADLLERIVPLDDARPITAEILARAAEALGAPGAEGLQPNFERTGGLHAAACLDEGGQILAGAEDIGRHNAVDKVVGALLAAGALRVGRSGERAPRPGDPAALIVSGRVSFEIVQKAAVARIPCVVGISAASSLAIDLAAEAGITLVAFARGDTCNVYTHLDRVHDLF